MGVTKKQIEAWKEQHGGVYLLELEDGLSAYLKEPTMLDWKRAMRGLIKDGELGYAEQLIDALWLEGDKAIKEDDKYFLAAKKQLDELIEYPDADIQKTSEGAVITILGKSCTVRKITRADLKVAERKNRENKPFVTQEELLRIVLVEADPEFSDSKNALYRFPLYKALDQLQSEKYASLKKL